MHTALQPLASILALDTRLLENCLAGLTDDTARQRPAGQANSAAFLAVHLVDARVYMLKLAGGDMPHPFGSRLDGVRAIDQMTWYPTLEQIGTAWRDVSARLTARLGELGDTELSARTNQKFPIGGDTVLDAIVFLAQHDAYHIGQLALLRRALGLPAMKY